MSESSVHIALGAMTFIVRCRAATHRSPCGLVYLPGTPAIRQEKSCGLPCSSRPHRFCGQYLSIAGSARVQLAQRLMAAPQAAPAAAPSVAPKPSVALLGIGLMGNKMARRLAEEGFPVQVWNRSPANAAPLAEVVVVVLADAQAIRDTILSSDVKHALAGKTVVQMGTIGPNQSREICEEVESAGGEYVEAPVLGSQPEASKGTLLIMVGARSDPALSRSRCWPVLTAFGPSPIYIGDVGTGAAVKLALNQLIASLTVGFSTSLALLQRSNVDVDKFMSILRPSALYAPTFDKKLQRMLDREYSQPNFPTKHLLKDVKLFREEASAVGVDTSLLEGLERVIQSTVDRGLDFTDYSAVYEGVLDPMP